MVLTITSAEQNKLLQHGFEFIYFKSINTNAAGSGTRQRCHHMTRPDHVPDKDKCCNLRQQNTLFRKTKDNKLNVF